MSFLESLSQHKWLLTYCLIGFTLNLIAYYPGFLSPDSFDQYTQAVTGKYDDWHSPVMAALWSLFLKLYKGTLLVLLFQLVLLWTAVYVLITTAKSRFWCVLIILFSLAPFVQNFAAYIVKDAQLAFTWLLAIAIMFRAGIIKGKLNKAEAIICFLLIVYGGWVRLNALPGAVPLCYLFCWFLFRKAAIALKLTAAIFFILFIGVGSWVFEYKIIQAEKTYPQTKLYLQDITGVYAKTGKSFYPAFLFNNSNFDTAILRKGYHPASFDHLWIGKNDSEIFPYDNEAMVISLQQAWIQAIYTYPLVYFQNKSLGFLYYLRILNRNDIFFYYFPGIYPVPNPLGLVYKRNIISDIFLKPIEFQKGMPYMKPWFWLLLNLFLFAFTGKFRNNYCSVVYKTLIASSLIYLLPTFFIFPTDTDFRYFYWNCISCSLALCILLLDRFYYTLETGILPSNIPVE